MILVLIFYNFLPIRKALMKSNLSILVCVTAALLTLQVFGQSESQFSSSLSASSAPVAQQEASPSQTSNSQQNNTQQNNPQPKPQSEQEKELQKQEQSQRILGLAPMFGVTSRQNAAPLTRGEKFHLFTKGAFDPFAFAAAGLQSGIGQAQNEFPGYGQGAAGYGKRYGASLADQVSSSFFSNYFYPVLLKEDPRYFRLGETSVKHRILYSLEQEFVGRTDKGTRSFNWSNVLGAFTAGGISNIYYPSTDRGAGLTLSRSAIALAYGSIGGLVDEFWPDVNRKLFHKKDKQKAAEQH
jgi:hypothetical protein